MKSYSLMLKIAFICAAFWLAACAPTRPTPTREAPAAATAEGTIPSPPDDLRDLACESIFDVDLTQAFRNSAYDTDLFWTIHFNFKSFDGSGNPVGCYRLYARDPDRGTFVAIDDGGQVIEGCEIRGNVAFDLIPLAFDSVGRGPVDTGVASFDGDSAVVCSFSIQELTNVAVERSKAKSGVDSVTELLAVNAVASSQHQSIVAEVERLRELLISHNLKTLTLVAAGQADYNQAQLANPVFFYWPADASAADCCTPIGMELPALDDRIGLFRAYLHGNLFRTSRDSILLSRAIDEGLLDDYLLASVMDGAPTVEEMAEWLSLRDDAPVVGADLVSELYAFLDTGELAGWLREVGLFDDWLVYLQTAGYLTEDGLKDLLEAAGLDVTQIIEEWTNRCTYAYEHPYYWWTNFQNTGAGAVTPIFARQVITSGESGALCHTVEWTPLPADALRDQYPGVPFAPQPMLQKVAVWTGPTQFYIGCRPDVTTGDCASYYTGDLYGVMIDPPDSKPQFD